MIALINVQWVFIFQNYDGASLLEFQSLRSAVTSSLQPGVEALKNVGNELFSASRRISDAYRTSQTAFRTFTQALVVFAV